jgi:hypothetical protein
MEINYVQINARTEKWRELINNPRGSNLQLIKNRVRKGIPSGIRIKVWPLLINI